MLSLEGVEISPLSLITKGTANTAKLAIKARYAPIPKLPTPAPPPDITINSINKKEKRGEESRIFGSQLIKVGI